MRWALIVLWAACKKDPAPAPPPPPTGSAAASADAAAIVADAVPAPTTTGGLVELLHNAPTEVVVSSRVANHKILPRHLVDRDLNTAWNSKTGELAGAWILVVARDGALIHELRLTVGHTGKGPKAEDYFTMNPRIRTVSVLDGSTVVATANLDIARRDLQTIALPTPLAVVKLRVDAVEPGSKKTWRETCVSELEAWGTLAPGSTARPVTPKVEVDAPSSGIADGGLLSDAYCAEFEKAAMVAYKQYLDDLNRSIAECKKQYPDKSDAEVECASLSVHPSGGPSCELGPDQAIAKGPWIAAGTLAVAHDANYGVLDVRPAVRTTKGWVLVGKAYDCAEFADQGPCTVEVVAATPNGDKLALRYRVTWRDAWKEYALTCTLAAKVTCDDDVEVGAGVP